MIVEFYLAFFSFNYLNLANKTKQTYNCQSSKYRLNYTGPPNREDWKPLDWMICKSPCGLDDICV